MARPANKTKGYCNFQYNSTYKPTCLREGILKILQYDTIKYHLCENCYSQASLRLAQLEIRTIQERIEKEDI